MSLKLRSITPPHPLGWRLTNNVIDVGKDVGKLEPLCCADGTVKGLSHYGITLWSTRSPPGYTAKELKAGSGRDICTHMFTAASFTVAGKWKRRRPLIDEWISKCGLYVQWRISLETGMRFWHVRQHGQTRRVLSEVKWASHRRGPTHEST